MLYNKAEEILSGTLKVIWKIFEIIALSSPDVAHLSNTARPNKRGSLRDPRQDLQRVLRDVRLRLLPHGGQECEERVLEDQS